MQDEHTHELGPEPGAEPQEHQDAVPEQEEIVVDQAVAEEAVSEQTVVEEALVEEAVAEEAVIEEVSFALEFQQEPEPEPEFEPAPVLEQAPEPEITIPVAEPAPLVSQPQATESAAPAGAAKELLGLPLQFLSQLLQKLGSSKLESIADLVPAARLVAIALLAGIALKITGASLDAINDIPLVGGLLELVGLVGLLNFLSRNALKAQKRAELLSRIRKLKQDFLG